jgi:integrase
MAELDPRKATIREVAQAYATKNKRGDAFVTSSVQFFKDIADEPGSAMRLFEKDADGITLLARTFKDSEDTSTVKTAMQNLRQVGLTLKGLYGPDTPEYKLLPDKAPNTDLNNRIFGRSEPAKSVSEVSINPDKEKMSQLFAGVAKYLDDPKTRPVAEAIIFNLNTGLRPNAAAGLKVTSYKPDSGAIYIESEAKGAKGRAVNIPLNPVADSILQRNLAAGNKDFFFVKENGKPVTSQDMTDLLKTVKVEDIAFDAATRRYFDTLAPEDFTGKKGSQLLRNVHATVGRSIGIDQDRLAYLQGRSLKSAGKTSTGELTTYQQAFPGAVGEVDRANANMFASFWGDAAAEAGFNIGERIPMPTERITTQTPGYEGYFDLPVQETDTPAPAAKKSLSLSQMAEALNSAVSSKTVKTGAGMLAGAAGVTALMTDPAEAAVPMAVEMGTEVGARSALKAALPMAAGTGPLAPAAIAAIVAAESASPSAGAGAQQLNVEEQMQLDVARKTGDIGVEKELMSREPITKVGGSDAPTFSLDQDLGQRVTRQTSTDEMTFQSIINRRKQRNAMNEQ